MYKSDNKLQSSFLDFIQLMGLHMNPENRWIDMADMIPWDAFEKKYKHLFKSNTGNVAKPLRMALGALIIQTRFQFSDRELVQHITENPYLQYFIGLLGYQETPPFDASTLVLFRKRINARMLMEANEYLLQENKHNKKDDDNDDLADQIYRTRDNRTFCQKHGIRLSGPKLGRPSKLTKSDKKIEYQDNTDRIEVECRFTLTKRCYGMGKIMTKLEDTQFTSIVLSVFVANIARMQQRILSTLFYLLDNLRIKEGWLPVYAG